MNIQEMGNTIEELRHIVNELNMKDIDGNIDIIIEGLKYDFISYEEVANRIEYIKNTNTNDEDKKVVLIGTAMRSLIEKEKSIQAYYNYEISNNGVIRYIADLEENSKGVGLEDIKEFIEKYIIKSKITKSEYLELTFNECTVANLILDIEVLKTIKNEFGQLILSKLINSRRVVDMNSELKNLAKTINNTVNNNDSIEYILSTDTVNNKKDTLKTELENIKIKVSNNTIQEEVIEVKRDEFKMSLLGIKEKINRGKLKPTTEEATKQWFILPLLIALGYNPYSDDVIPEYSLDIGIKKGEKVDYVLQSGSKQVAIMECKQMNKRLSNTDISQLYRYFTVSDVHIAILTNGNDYWFFTDSIKENVMDLEPYYKIRLSIISSLDIDRLKQYSKENIVNIAMREVVRDKG